MFAVKGIIMFLEGLALAVGVLVTPELAPTRRGSFYQRAAAGWRPGERRREDGAVRVVAAVYKAGAGRAQKREERKKGRNKRGETKTKEEEERRRRRRKREREKERLREPTDKKWKKTKAGTRHTRTCLE